MLAEDNTSAVYAFYTKWLFMQTLIHLFYWSWSYESDFCSAHVSIFYRASCHTESVSLYSCIIAHKHVHIYIYIVCSTDNNVSGRRVCVIVSVHEICSRDGVGWQLSQVHKRKTIHNQTLIFFGLLCSFRGCEGATAFSIWAGVSSLQHSKQLSVIHVTYVFI